MGQDSAGERGGGVEGGVLNNCVLTGNSAGRAGAAAWASLNNCTLTGNSADWFGGGTLYGTLNNCIVYYNSAPSGQNYSGGTLNYCCTTPLPAGGLGNIDVDPQLASASHLGAGSPCIGAGSVDYATGTDIDGETWADPPSVGCDESHSGSVTGPLSAQIDAAYTEVAVGYGVDFRALIAGAASSSAWDFGDGTVVSNQPYTSHAWMAPGIYPVVLTAWNDSSPGGMSETVMVQVVEAVHYVVLGSPTPVWPYASWDTAAPTIQEAVDAAAIAGAALWVSNGVYATGGRAVHGTMTNRVAVDKALIVRSVNGPDVTIIEGYQVPGTTNGVGAIRCVYLAEGAVLSGFTLTNGATLSKGGWGTQLSGGGVWCESLSALVLNCVVIGNSAAYIGGGVWQGTLNNCNLTGNSARGGLAGFGGGAYYAKLSKCVLVGNEAHIGGGAYGGTLNNCWLAGNAAYIGGGASGSRPSKSWIIPTECTLNNCTLTGNSAGLYGGGAYTSILNDCVLTGNSVRWYGGGAYFSALYQCTLIGNSASLGGGAYQGTLNNCTLTGNSADVHGGGVAEAVLNNCIVYYNTAPVGENYHRGWAELALDYCCTFPMPTNGVGNITNAPLFVDTNNWSNFRLQPASPCIDAGNNDFVATLTDLDGNPRILNGIVDMGAYEFVPPTPAEMVERLLALVNEFNMHQKRPLLASLEAALASIHRGNHNSATGQLRAFQSKVEAQLAKKDVALAMELIEGAQQVLDALHEEPSGRLAGKIHSLKRHSNGKMQITIRGEAGKIYILEASTNLMDWKPICVVSPDEEGNWEYEDVVAAKHHCRFYRVVAP